MKNQNTLPSSYFLSYACGFVYQTTYELTPKQYLEFILMLISYLESPLITKLQVTSLNIDHHKVSLRFDSNKTLVIDTSSYTKKDITLGGGAFNNYINQCVLHHVLLNNGPTNPFPLIANSSLAQDIEESYSKLYKGISFQPISGKPRQAAIFTCPSIQEHPNPIHDALPKSVNIHDRVPTLYEPFDYCPVMTEGFYVVNNHEPNETFECLESLNNEAEIEFRIGSSQIHQLCKVELPKFKNIYPNLKPKDCTISRSQFPVLWLLKRANRVCLNLGEVHQIVDPKYAHKFLPKNLEKKALMTRFVEDFNIKEAIVSDNTHPLNFICNDTLTSNIHIHQYTLTAKQVEEIKQTFLANNCPTCENETGCGDALVVGLQIARQLCQNLKLKKSEKDIAEFGLFIATTKYFWKESNLGKIPLNILEKILSNSSLLQ